jgi:hypothetical protein
MSLRDFNEISQPLHTEPTGNGAGLGSFHTINPEDREPSKTPKIVGALAVALMVGVAGVGLYAYSGSSQPKPAVADNNLPQPPASAPIAPAPQLAANTPADTTTPASTATANDSTPAAAPVKEASAKPVKTGHHAASDDSSATRSASNAASARMGVDSTQSTQAPAQQAAVAPSATPLPSAPQPSPSDVATTNTQSGQAVQPGATSASDMPAQQPAAPQPAAPTEQTGAAPAQ